MKIAFIVGVFPSLSETFVLNQITGLIDLGHEVKIFAGARSKKKLYHNDVHSYRLLDRVCYFHDKPQNKLLRIVTAVWILISKGYKCPRAILSSLNFFKYGADAISLSLFYKVVHFLDAADADIVYCHFGQNGLLAVMLKQIGIIKGKIITVFHAADITSYVNRHGKDVYHPLFREGRLFLTVSEFGKNILLALGCDRDKVLVHHMGVNVDRFIPAKQRDSSRIRLLTVARLVEKKGIVYGIDAVSKLLKVYPNVEYRIVGDGPLKSQLKRYINELKISDKVYLVGGKNQEEIIKLMQESHVFIMSSITDTHGATEGIPVVLMEAMAMKMVVVATRHAGIVELVEDGKTGFLVEEKDVDAIVNRLEYIIGHKDEYVQIGEAARSFIVQHFNIKRLNKLLGKYFLSVVQA